jgi:hypothetical protein
VWSAIVKWCVACDAVVGACPNLVVRDDNAITTLDNVDTDNNTSPTNNNDDDDNTPIDDILRVSDRASRAPLSIVADFQTAQALLAEHDTLRTRATRALIARRQRLFNAIEKVNTILLNCLCCV